MKDRLLAARQALSDSAERLSASKATIGFDGFIDEIIHAVDVRSDKDTYVPIPTIEALGKRILSAAGKSANIELVPLRQKLGGNGPLMASALGSLGPKIVCVGLMGKPLQAVFEKLALDLPNIEMISAGDPGFTQALEFTDGKLMLGKPGTMRDMNWPNLVQALGKRRDEVLFGGQILAATNWTQLTEMTPLLVEMEKVLPVSPNLTIFIDLADPEKRPKQDLLEVLNLFSVLQKKAKVILGVNLREAEQVSEVLGIAEVPQDSVEGGKTASKRIADKMGIHGVVIHMVAYASAFVGGVSAGVPGPFCAKPVLTTGAGDHFNGGFTAGHLAGLPLEQCLWTGVCTSGTYVRIGRSPSFGELLAFQENWAEGRLADCPAP
ncbi:MAG TPA: PfkB family carbohydrate kinase [Fibrobacteria bacterium]|nr:PfkB family carbohydrate kinase [Fibrobacteria bacterium]